MNTLPIVPECLKNSLVDAMFKRFRFISLTLVILAAVLLSSCIDRLYGLETDYLTGVPLTPEMIESIIDAATLTEAEMYPTETDINGNLIVYWLPGGSVWHASRNCSSLQKASADNISNGSIDDAISEGKDRPCKICSEEINYTAESDNSDSSDELSHEVTAGEEETLKYQKEYSGDGTLLVYWTKSGSVWHESSFCPSLANTSKDNLICGSEEEAISAGKDRACKKCS